MIGSGLKKLAKENNMKVAHGVAYGALCGYAATLSEGSGYKQIVLTTKFPDPVKLQELQEKLNSRNIQRELRVRNLTFAPNGVSIVFMDNPGTMKRIYEFIQWFFPMLEESGATKWNVCTECGFEVAGGTWKLVDGIAFYLHQTCAEKMTRDIESEETERREADTGNYFTGLLGALAGSAIGAVLWAVVLSLGYVASLVGLVIGWLSEKGYNLFKGKQGKAKIAILIVAVIFGVLLGNFASDAFTLFTMIQGGELPGMVLADIPGMILLLLLSEPEYRSATISNVLMGLLFAGLGVFSLLRKAGREVSATKVITLE